ncbi:TPA: hypothetical protein ACP32N_003284 [Pseudomonas aeruginosa]
MLAGALTGLASALLMVSSWTGVIETGPIQLGWLLFPEFLASVLPAGHPLVEKALGGALWMACGLPLLSYLYRRGDILRAGGLEACRASCREEEERARTPTPVGTLVNLTISKGGLFSNSTTLVETTEGFFHVAGPISSAEKGAQVYILQPQHLLTNLLIGDPANAKRYRVE